MNETNDFGFRVGDVVPEGFLPPPTMDEALSMIADYTRSNKLSPATLIDIFNTGIAVRSIALGANKGASHA